MDVPAPSREMGANEMSLIDKVKENWQALAVIGGIVAASIVGWNYAMAQAKEVAQQAVEAKVNKAMIDGAKQAAADAVKEQLPAIAAEVAKQTAAAVVEAQKNEEKKKGGSPR